MVRLFLSFFFFFSSFFFFLIFYFRIILRFWRIKILLGVRSNEGKRRLVVRRALILNAGIFSKIFRTLNEHLDAVGIFQVF